MHARHVAVCAAQILHLRCAEGIKGLDVEVTEWLSNVVAIIKIPVANCDIKSGFTVTCNKSKIYLKRSKKSCFVLI